MGGTLDGWDLKRRELDTLPPGSLTAKLPGQATLVLIAPQSVVTYPPKHLLFVPEPPTAPSISEVFGNAAKFEYRDQNYSAAIEALRPLADQPATLAEALLRIGRIERLDHPSAALAIYDRLSLENSVNPDGVPYALLALGARCDLMDQKAAD